MALEIRQNLRLSQQLVITPQLQQAIKLLQLSRLELQNLVQHELLENPVLEELPEEVEAPVQAEEISVTEPAALVHESKDPKADEVGTKTGDMKEPSNFDWENYAGLYSSSEMGPSEPMEVRDDLPSYENTLSQKASLQDHLLWQLHMSELTSQELEVAEELVGGINDEGYLQADLSEIAANNHCEPVFVEETLKKVQEFDPPGVGARDLRECLKIQARPFEEKEGSLLEVLIDRHLEDIERKNYAAITRDLGISMERLRDLTHLLSTFEPKPGRPFGGERPQYIIPDVYVEKVGNDYVVLLNDDGLPKLQVSNLYRNLMMKKEMEVPAKEYIQEKMRSAIWLIRSIHQRQRTLYRVTQSIVKFQREFLEKGVSCLRPMVLKDVAEDIQMHESTISRVTTNKYVQTPRGIFELKFFFNNRVPSGNGDGITSEAVKDEIRKMIAAEDPKKPLSDQTIAEYLQKNSIQVARRTVAKYREILGIQPSSRRRQVF